MAKASDTLPEHPYRLELPGDPRLIEADIIAKTREGCLELLTHAPTLLSNESRLLYKAHLWSAYMVMSRLDKTPDPPPIVYLAFYGIDALDKKYVRIELFSICRELEKIHCVASTPDGTNAYIEYDLAPKTKELECQITLYEHTEWMRWDDFLRKCDDDKNTRYMLKVTGGEPWPFPVDDGVRLVIGVEDRRGRISGFVPMYRLDIPSDQYGFDKADVETNSH